MKVEEEGRSRRIYCVQVRGVHVGARLASIATFVEPQDLLRARHDQPTVEQEQLLLPQPLHVQVNEALGRTEVARLVAAAAEDLIASGQVEHGHVPLASFVAHATHRHQVMLVGQQALDLVLLGHEESERFAQRVQVMHSYALARAVFTSLSGVVIRVVVVVFAGIKFE